MCTYVCACVTEGHRKCIGREVKTPSSVGLSDDVIDAEKCLCVEYQRRDNIPGFEILTNDDNFLGSSCSQDSFAPQVTT